MTERAKRGYRGLAAAHGCYSAFMLILLLGWLAPVSVGGAWLLYFVGLGLFLTIYGPFWVLCLVLGIRRAVRGAGAGFLLINLVLGPVTALVAAPVLLQWISTR